MNKKPDIVMIRTGERWLIQFHPEQARARFGFHQQRLISIDGVTATYEHAVTNLGMKVKLLY